MKKLNEGAINKIRGYMDTSYTMAEEDFESLYSKIKAGKVELNQSVITAKEGSKYIESIYMGYPLPAVTIAEYNGILKIIDGRKFVTAIIRFMEGKYELIGLRELKELNGCNYADIKETLINYYMPEDATFIVRTIKIKNEAERYKLFERYHQI